ncbi:MAG: cysteine--1-D-myo-inosityl 2-amino-2-deoxy-alpha-D-glucopyranoside ligase [Propionibacteriaceae bacterium]|nr:cysteine--1-D-myo-inosityl 2-amino-2-deoxy-alpha-D-glucopyranoside ligase [Propionibacteriaceae bacterium]
MHSWKSPALPSGQETVPGELRLFDTVEQAVVPVGPGPGEDRPATMYVCGITPYDATHLGHAFTYLTFDLVNRVWRDLGVEVRYSQNVTDVDDPLLERAGLTGVDWQDLAADQTALFTSDMEALRILAPDSFLTVTEALPLIDDAMSVLHSTHQIYQLDDCGADWYFSFDGRPGFGRESHLDGAEMLASFADHGGDPDRVGKKHPLDALVWRQARDNEPWWESVLGPGRPGWHLECAAIACSTLGTGIDLQGGGSDLIFPHHEMCAIQAQAFTGLPFARAFVHSAMVWLDGEKMSKSKGNLVTVSDLLGQRADPMAIRLALLGHHYRADWQWHPEFLAQATRRLDLWREAVHAVTSVDAGPAIAEVRDLLRDDLRADRALEVIDAWAVASLAAEEDHPGARQQMADLADGLLGVGIA